MAACGSRTGQLEFFDPNAGVVGSLSKQALVACLTSYFATPELKASDVYKDRTRGTVLLYAKKYKS